MDGAAETRAAATDDAALAERRQHKRVGVMWMATLSAAFGFLDCMVLDVSLGGAKLMLSAPLGMPPAMALIIEGFGTFRAELVWQRGEVIGVRFLTAPAIIARAFAAIMQS